MSLTPIEFDTLGALDGGRARAIADEEIRRAVQDLMDRGQEDGKPRSVNFTLEMQLDRGKIVAHLGAQAKLPARRTAGTSCIEQARRGTGESVFVFRDDNPENAEQQTLDDMAK